MKNRKNMKLFFSKKIFKPFMNFMVQFDFSKTNG